MSEQAKRKRSPSLRTITAVGIGLALYVVLAICLQVPVFENYYLCLGYVALMVYCCVMGPMYGAIVGFIGCILHCLLINGLRGMPGWALGNLFIGLSMGYAFAYAKRIPSRAMRYVCIAAAAIAATAVGILGIKSLVEMVIYALPFWARVIKNTYAFIADCVVLIVSIPVCFTIERILSKHGKAF